MDALVELLPLLFIGAYYLLAGRRRAQQKQEMRQRAQTSPAAGATADGATVAQREPTPFQSFLEQLEEAMAEASGEPDPAAPQPRPAPPPALPEPPPVTSPVPSLPSPGFTAPIALFDGLAAADHAAHGYGAQNPLSEQTFEERPAFAEPSRTETPGYDPHGLRRTPSAPPKRGWQKRLGDPKAAQDAFVLQTVFGARGGRQAERRR